MTNETQFILYQLPDEEGVIQVVVKDETIWATQKAMAALFGVDKSGISRHVANIFKDGELKQETTVAKIATVIQGVGKKQPVGNSDKFIQLFSRKIGIPDLSSVVANFAITADYFHFGNSQWFGITEQLMVVFSKMETTTQNNDCFLLGNTRVKVTEKTSATSRLVCALG